MNVIEFRGDDPLLSRRVRSLLKNRAVAVLLAPPDNIPTCYKTALTATTTKPI